MTYALKTRIINGAVFTYLPAEPRQAPYYGMKFKYSQRRNSRYACIDIESNELVDFSFICDDSAYVVEERDMYDELEVILCN